MVNAIDRRMMTRLTREDGVIKSTFLLMSGNVSSQRLTGLSEHQPFMSVRYRSATNQPFQTRNFVMN